MAGKYSPELCDEICERLSNGEPLRQICRDEHMPTWRSVYDWLGKYPDFASAIARARELGYDAIAEECFEIADDAKNDWMEKFGKDGSPGYELNGDHVQRSKLRIWTRTQLLAKWSPKKYGDKQQIDLNAKVNIGEMSEAEIAAELAALGVALPELTGAPQDDSEDDARDLV
jgi:hypothetical protein